MNRAGKRLLIAAIISSVGALCMVQWHRWSSAGDFINRGDRKAIAILAQTAGQGVERRTKGHVIWQEANQGENLYEGESIRTADGAEAKIELKESQIAINLEANSLVVLEENSLDFKAGNLFLDFGSGAEHEFKILSEQGEISSSKGSLSLGRGSDGDLNVQVLSGVAQVRTQDQTLSMATDSAGVLSASGLKNMEDMVVVLSPKPGTSVFADFDRKDKIEFQWRPLPKGYELVVESGSEREPTNLTPVNESGVAGEQGQVNLEFPYHHKYFRLVARSNDEAQPELRSPVLPLQLVRVRSPFPRNPEPGEQLVLSDLTQPVRFLWSNRMVYRDLSLEISDNPALKDSKVIRLSQDHSRFVPELHLENFNGEGIYYWRLTGYVDGYDSAVTNPVQSFELKVGHDVRPPQLLNPEAGQRLTALQVAEQGLYLRWESVPGIKKYRLLVYEKGAEADTERVLFEEQVPQNFFALRQGPVGSYSWRVHSIGPSGQESSASPSLAFEVEDVPLLAWAEQRKSHLYATKEASLDIGIKKEPAAAKTWRIRIASEGDGLAQAQWQVLSETHIKEIQGQPVVHWRGELARAGTYLAQAQALDEQGDVIAQTHERSILVQEKPLLRAPEFADRLPASLEADASGALKLMWKIVEGARSYRLELLSEAGDLVKSETYAGTTARLKDLFPGLYSVRLHSIDEHDRIGPAGDVRQLVVPDTSDVSAPAIKQMKVK